MNQSFSKIRIIIILIILIGGGFFAWQYWWIPKGPEKIPTEEIKVGKVEIDYSKFMVTREEWEKSGGHQPWRLDPELVVKFEGTSYGFSDEDFNTINQISLLSTDGIAKYLVNHKGKNYIITVVKPNPSKNVFWTISEIEPGVETADWKTYKNEGYGFEIKYPTIFFIEDEINGVEFIEEQWKGQTVHFPFIGIQFIKTPLTPQQWVDEKGTEVSLVEEPPSGFQSFKYEYFGVKNKITKTIGMLQVFQFYSAGVSGANDNTLIQQKDNTLINIYRHSSGMGEVSKDIYNQMLSTFKFLK